LVGALFPNTRNKYFLLVKTRILSILHPSKETDHALHCHKKTVRKVVKSCPTVSVETTILTELRNLYEFVVAKFVALFDTLTAWHTSTDKTYTFTAGEPDRIRVAYPITVPDKALTLVFEVTGLPVDPAATVSLIAPGADEVWRFRKTVNSSFPLSPRYHTANAGLSTWTIRANGTFPGPLYDNIAFKMLVISEA
jgi:hypothetical protein